MVNINYYVAIFKYTNPVAVLKMSGEFEEIGNREPKDINGLKVFSSYLQAKNSIKGKIIRYKDKEFEAFSSDGLISTFNIDIESYRIEKPFKSFFTKEDVKKAISTGNDIYNNRLVVDKDGKVFLTQGHALERGFVVVNSEVFSAGNNYVGLEASQDEEFIENEYERLLLAWKLHLESGGVTSWSNDYYQEIDVNDTIINIKKIITDRYV